MGENDACDYELILDLSDTNFNFVVNDYLTGTIGSWHCFEFSV